MATFSDTTRRQPVDHNYVNNDYNAGNGAVLGGNTTGVTTNDYDNRNNYQNIPSAGPSGYHDEKRRHQSRSQRVRFDINSGEYNRRPSFGQWIKFTWLDILTMLVIGAIALGVYFARPAPSRAFPVNYFSGDTVMPQFAYPVRREIFPIWSAVLLSVFVPIIVILCMQARIKSFWDANNAIIGLLYAIISAAIFQVFVKWLIGGLAPNFLSVCQPDAGQVSAGGIGFNNGMYQRNVCRGNAKGISRALESFPSGQSTVALAGFLFLYFYLNAKMKVFSNHHPAMWRLIALYAPLLAATLIACSSTIDEYHHWYDVLAGAIIGSVFALSAYRMVYASIWDFRFNHIPLTRHTPFSYGAGRAGAGGFESAVFTRTAGWGFEEAYGGAPFDAAHGLRGQTAGFNQGAAGLNHGSGMMGQRRNGGVVNHEMGHSNRNKHHGAEAAVGAGILGGILGSRKNDRDHGHRNSGVMGHNTTNEYQGNSVGATHDHVTNQSATEGGILDGLGGHKQNQTIDPTYNSHNSNQRGIATGYDNNNSHMTGYNSNIGSTHPHGYNQSDLTGNNYNPNSYNTNTTSGSTGGGVISSMLPGHHTSNSNTTTTTSNLPGSHQYDQNALSSNTGAGRDNVRYATEPYSHSNTYSNTPGNTRSGVGGYTQSSRTIVGGHSNTNGGNANYNTGTTVTNY